MLQRQKLIFGIFIFFFASSSFCVFNSYDFSELSLSCQISSDYPLEDLKYTIGYNMLTGTEEVEYFSNIESSSYPSYTPPYQGNNKDIQSDDLGISYIFPPDDRVRITTTATYPWSTICYVHVIAADDTEWTGSGVIIDAYHVLTCGHLIYHHDNGGWPNQVKIIPGKRGSFKPFGEAYATYARSYPEWVQDENSQHDWAVITLDRTIGNRTGWMGRMTADPLDPIYTGTLHTAGYPGDLFSAQYMYYCSDVGADADSYNHWYWMDTAGGQSGSPIWAEVNGTNYILSIHAYEYESGSYANFGTRLNQDKFDQLNTWLAADTPPVDSGWDPNLAIIITFSATFGIAIVVIGLIIYQKRSRPKLVLAESYRDEITHIEPSISQQLRSQAFGFCPECGTGIFRDTQRFCSKCGHKITLNSDHDEST